MLFKGHPFHPCPRTNNSRLFTLLSVSPAHLLSLHTLYFFTVFPLFAFSALRTRGGGEGLRTGFQIFCRSSEERVSVAPTTKENSAAAAFQTPSARIPDGIARPQFYAGGGA